MLNPTDQFWKFYSQVCYKDLAQNNTLQLMFES